MAQDFKKNSGDLKLVAQYERDQKTVNADSDYKPLREALIKEDMDAAVKAYKKLLITKSADLIASTMNQSRPFTGSHAAEQRFIASLTDAQRKTLEEAKGERQLILARFNAMPKGGKSSEPKEATTLNQLFR